MGLCIIFLQIIKKYIKRINTKYKTIIAYGRLFPNIKEAIQLLLTFTFAVFGWIIFRAESMSQAYGFVTSIFTHPFLEGLVDGKKWLFASLLLLLVEWFQRDKQHALDFPQNKFFRHRLARWLVYYILICIIINFAGSSQSFIYFQF